MSEIATINNRSLVARTAGRFGVDADKLMSTLKATAFKAPKGGCISNEQMMALLVVADQYGLNPFTKEIYAFPDKGGIVPVVGVDGWLRIINQHPQFDGMAFTQPPMAEWVEMAGARQAPGWLTCLIYRKDRQHAIEATEYLDEVFRNTGPWQSHTKRMLRHKAIIQCGRMAFGFAGIYDPDEAQRVIEGQATPVVEDVRPAESGMAALGMAIAPEPEPADSLPEIELQPPTVDDCRAALNAAENQDDLDFAIALMGELHMEDRQSLEDTANNAVLRLEEK